MATSSFREKVTAFVKTIPRGKVASYGQVAAAAGHPGAARQVGGILRGLDINAETVPWWRVVNNQGFLSIRGNWTATRELQRQLLLKEGVEVDKDFHLDMENFRYNKTVFTLL